ncbi:hypothetical protein PLAN_70220 [Planktothrix rubescens CCAP 1459/22]|uniref:Uncharacterized protein n=1 Tax=Planktothrix rubescens CCAP 1459/22 TaxID=329571 RepID=A0A6J7ZTD7_PLARU|nr:hypothetical protein PLAN_70220 [Planktothrix rubescens NIVA-CYA 18]
MIIAIALKSPDYLFKNKSPKAKPKATFSKLLFRYIFPAVSTILANKRSIVPVLS